MHKELEGLKVNHLVHKVLKVLKDHKVLKDLKDHHLTNVTK